MKILIICHFPLAGSGSGTYTRNIAVYLTEKGHEVRIIMPENTVQFNKIDNVPIYPVYFTDDRSNESISGALPFNFPCFTTHPRSSQTFYDLDDRQIEEYIAAFQCAAEKVIRDFRPDIIHAQHVWILAWVAMKTGIPYVITSHGTDFIGYRKTDRFRPYADEAAREAKAIITISNDNDLLARELFPGSASKIRMMKNGFDPARFYPGGVTREKIFSEFNLTPLPKVVLFAGKLTHFKGVDVLLEAAKLYEGENPGQIITLIAGDGELSDQLKAQAEKYKLRNVHFLGFVPVFQLRMLYSFADVAVVPSRREPFGLVAIEALACGCPVVATNQGGLPDIVTDSVGTLVNVDDPLGLAEAIQKELFNPDRADRGQCAAQYAKDYFSQSALIGSLIDVYEEALS